MESREPNPALEDNSSWMETFWAADLGGFRAQGWVVAYLDPGCPTFLGISYKFMGDYPQKRKDKEGPGRVYGDFNRDVLWCE